jgi:hypothetical protein
MSNKKRFSDDKLSTPSKISGLNLNNLIDILPCSISIQNSELRILLVNQNFKNYFGDATGRLCYTVYKGSNVAAVIDMATNISQVKTDQKELVTLGQSIALLSHGIKNILEGLEGGAYVVDEGLKEGDLEFVKKGWNIVSKNIFKISDFVKNILYASKTRPLKYEIVSPGQLVNAIG